MSTKTLKRFFLFCLNLCTQLKRIALGWEKWTDSLKRNPKPCKMKRLFKVEHYFVFAFQSYRQKEWIRFAFYLISFWERDSKLRKLFLDSIFCNLIKKLWRLNLKQTVINALQCTCIYFNLIRNYKKVTNKVILCLLTAQCPVTADLMSSTVISDPNKISQYQISQIFKLSFSVQFGFEKIIKKHKHVRNVGTTALFSFNISTLIREVLKRGLW